MNKFLRNSLVASAVAVAGVVSVAGNTSAQSVDVNFYGTVSTACSIITVLNGTIGVSTLDPTILTSNPNEATGVGVLGAVSVNCNGDGTVTASTPVGFQDAQSLPLISSYVTLHTDSNASSPDYDGVLQTFDSAAQTLYVNMYVQSSNLIPGGNYEYVTAVTVTPN